MKFLSIIVVLSINGSTNRFALGSPLGRGEDCTNHSECEGKCKGARGADMKCRERLLDCKGSGYHNFDRNWRCSKGMACTATGIAKASDGTADHSAKWGECTATPTASPTLAPTGKPTGTPTPAPTGTPTPAPTKSPTTSALDMGLSPTMTSAGSCVIDTEGYFKVMNNASCGLADSTGALVVVDYTAEKYTKYTFTMKMGDDAVDSHNGGNTPHGGFKPCNKDGTSTSRGSSPEFWFIDRGGDWGYGTYNGGFGHAAHYTDRNDARYITADPHNGVALPWEIVMEWKENDLWIVSWKVAGSDFFYANKRGACPDNNNNYGFTPKLWAYGGSTFYLKDFAYSQAGTIEGL